MVVWIAAMALLLVGRTSLDSTQALSTIWIANNSSVINHTISVTGGDSLISNALLANLAQILVTYIYLWYNNAPTCILLARETSAFSKQRKPLRVSRPIPGSTQKSTY